MESSSKYPRHFYLMPNRPPSIGTHPAGEIARKTWLPKALCPFHPNPALIGTQTFCGWVLYDNPALVDDIRRYELVPADPKEYALYILHKQSADSQGQWDAQAAQRLRKEYSDQGTVNLVRLFDTRQDPIALACLILEDGISYWRAMTADPDKPTEMEYRITYGAEEAQDILNGMHTQPYMNIEHYEHGVWWPNY